MDTLTKSKTFSQEVSSFEMMKEMAHDLLRDFLFDSSAVVRRIGIKVSNFDESSGFQKKLFEF
jgi:hypothetical protein